MESKQQRYEQSYRELESVLEGIEDHVAVMATINCILKTNMEDFFWVGFYRVVDGALLVGPYQGTMGCLRIEFGRGVCGTCAAEMKTQIVADVHQFPGHIACDSRSNSEIVVPVTDKKGALIAVFDVDSTRFNTFDEVDREWLERIMARFFH
ncbi:MAG: GAF domain-containing protein [Acidobacteriota bacterium]|nr:GAF domain-containing protein [Acidobacteriota bacterium]